MSKFKLSKRSLQKLDGVHPVLVETVQRAIKYTPVDFAVIEGRRTLERQKELVAKGASKTMNSKHLAGMAVDLMAFIGDRPSWEIQLYDDIADSMAIAANELKIKIRWGAAWHVSDIANYPKTMREAMIEYVDQCRSKNRRPFIDGPHFELN